MGDYILTLYYIFYKLFLKYFKTFKIRHNSPRYITKIGRLINLPYFIKRFIYSFCHFDRSGAYLVIRSAVLYLRCHFDQALAHGEISLFVVPYFLLRDFSTTLEMTNYKPIKSTCFKPLKKVGLNDLPSLYLVY